jgi:CheY-like chemotaxis protein
MNKKTVLIVEDEMDMRIFISTLLETSGYVPLMTRDGKEGLIKARDVSPDLIILDVMMPGEGGVQMFRQLKMDQTLKGIPVIMLSAVAQKTFSHYLNMVNARLDEPIPRPEAYIEKPPEAEELLKMTASLIGQ